MVNCKYSDEKLRTIFSWCNDKIKKWNLYIIVAVVLSKEYNFKCL